MHPQQNTPQEPQPYQQAHDVRSQPGAAQQYASQTGAAIESAASSPSRLPFFLGVFAALLLSGGVYFAYNLFNTKAAFAQAAMRIADADSGRYELKFDMGMKVDQPGDDFSNSNPFDQEVSADSVLNGDELSLDSLSAGAIDIDLEFRVNSVYQKQADGSMAQQGTIDGSMFLAGVGGTGSVDVAAIDETYYTKLRIPILETISTDLVDTWFRFDQSTIDELSEEYDLDLDAEEVVEPDTVGTCTIDDAFMESVIKANPDFIKPFINLEKDGFGKKDIDGQSVNHYHTRMSARELFVMAKDMDMYMYNNCGTDIAIEDDYETVVAEMKDSTGLDIDQGTVDLDLYRNDGMERIKLNARIDDDNFMVMDMTVSGLNEPAVIEAPENSTDAIKFIEEAFSTTIGDSYAPSSSYLSSGNETRMRIAAGLSQAAVTQYSANNSGQLPADHEDFIEKIIYSAYLEDEDMLDPETGEYYYDNMYGLPSSLEYIKGAKCLDDVAVNATSSRSFAIVYYSNKLEPGCMDSR